MIETFLILIIIGWIFLIWGFGSFLFRTVSLHALVSSGRPYNVNFLIEFTSMSIGAICLTFAFGGLL